MRHRRVSGLVLWTKAHKELLEIMQKYPKTFFLIYHQFADVKCQTDGILLLALVPQTLHERWTVTTSVSHLTTGQASCATFLPWQNWVPQRLFLWAFVYLTTLNNSYS